MSLATANLEYLSCAATAALIEVGDVAIVDDASGILTVDTTTKIAEVGPNCWRLLGTGAAGTPQVLYRDTFLGLGQLADVCMTGWVLVHTRPTKGNFTICGPTQTSIGVQYGEIASLNVGTGGHLGIEGQGGTLDVNGNVTDPYGNAAVALTLDTKYAWEIHGRAVGGASGVTDGIMLRMKVFNSSGTLLWDSGWKYSSNLSGGSTNVFAGVHVGNIRPLTSLEVGDVYFGGIVVVSGGACAPRATSWKTWKMNAVSGGAGEDAWTLGAGADKVVAVDDTPDNGDTDYIKALTNVKEYYTHGGSGIPGGSNVLAVGVRASLRKVGAGACTARVVMKRTSQPSISTNALTTAYTWLQRYWRSTDTEGVDWTITNVDATLFGVQGSVGGTNEPRCTGLVAFAAYGPDHAANTYGGEEAVTNPLLREAQVI